MDGKTPHVNRACRVFAFELLLELGPLAAIILFFICMTLIGCSSPPPKDVYKVDPAAFRDEYRSQIGERLP